MFYSFPFAIQFLNSYSCTEPGGAIDDHGMDIGDDDEPGSAPSNGSPQQHQYSAHHSMPVGGMRSPLSLSLSHLFPLAFFRPCLPTISAYQSACCQLLLAFLIQNCK
jgi:hypothetical protein